MPTQPIDHAVQGYTYKRPKRASEDAEFPLGPEQSKNRQEATAETGATVRGFIRNLLEKAVPDGADKLSFRDVAEHHAREQSRWNRETSEDLAGLGVDTDSVFRLAYDPSGGVTVLDNHPDREMINTYFTVNPARGEELGEVMRLGKLVSAAESRLSPQDMDQTLSTEGMAWWYASNMDTSTLFKGGGTVFGATDVPYKGVDIRV